MSVRDQIVINYFNTFLRGEEFEINDSGKALD